MPDSKPLGLIRSLEIQNFLSFGAEGQSIELTGLNVLIGPNGSGKSNIIEALAVLAASPSDLSLPFRGGGGARTWIHNMAEGHQARLGLTVQSPSRQIKHEIQFGEESQRFFLENEIITSVGDDLPLQTVYVLNRDNTPDSFYPDFQIKRNQSVLSAYKDPSRDSEMSILQNGYGRIRLYRTWTVGPKSAVRATQPADLPNNLLAEDYSNLYLMLNGIEFTPAVKAIFIRYLREFLPDVTDYKLLIQGGTVQLFLQERENSIPAARLSDGTIRWLCLLAIFLGSTIGGVIVLEEPEIGLHPDMINTLADLLKSASRRMQLIVTTHSDILIDALSDTPESVLVVDKEDGQSKVTRLNEETLRPWLENYRLGRLWMKGEIGGTRW